MKSKIFEGRTSTEAIEKGLKECNVSKKDVEIKILEQEEKRSFFSILTPRIVKVEMKLKEKEEYEEKEKNETKKIEKIDIEMFQKAMNNIKVFLESWIPLLKIEEVEYQITDKNPFIEVTINGKNLNYLIGHRGEVLNELQNLLTNKAVKKI